MASSIHQGLSKEATAVAEELNNWKLNSSLLYDYVATHVLEWPSLTIDAIARNESGGGSCNDDDDDDDDDDDGDDGDIAFSRADLENDLEVCQSLLIGTHTSNSESNSVMFMDVLVPVNPVIDADSRVYSVHSDYAGFKFGCASEKFFCRATIPHTHGEANRIRSMPNNFGVFATISVGGIVTLFNAREAVRTSNSKSKLKSSSSSSSSSSSNSNINHNHNFSSNSKTKLEFIQPATVSLVCHDREGWALNWSSCRSGYLATGADDMKVCIWDVQTCPNGKYPVKQAAASSMSPVLIFQKHLAAVQDVVWSPSHTDVLFSVADDGLMHVWDLRKPSSSQEVRCSSLPTNTVSVSQIKPTLLATAGADKDVSLWDLRNLKLPLYRLSGHESMVTRVEFAPQSDRLVASCGGNRVLLWDLYAIGREQKPEDASDGPPELVFTHAGHAGVVNDVTWNPNRHSAAVDSGQMIVSVSDDNQLQLWSITQAILDDDDDEDYDEDGEGGDVENNNMETIVE